MKEIISAIESIRAPLSQGEYDLHEIIKKAFIKHNISFVHEAKLGPRCRIDFLAGDIGIEIKKGKPNAKILIAQLQKYMAYDQIKEMIVVIERSVMLPSMLYGKRCHTISINRLWGIAL